MESIPEIQALHADEIDSAAEMVAGLEFFRSYGYGREDFLRMLQGALTDKRSILICAKRDERLLGLAWLVSRAGFDRSAYLRLLAVSQPEQGRGLGRKLVEHLESRHLGQGGIFLLVTEDNLPAKAFYERLGYRQTGRLPDYVRQGRVECVYFKPPPMPER